MENAFDTPRPVRLVVAIGGGSVTVTAIETGRSTVTVEGPRADEFTVELSGDELRVIEPRQRTGFLGGRDDHRVTVTVPTGSDLATRAGSANLRAEGRFGAVQAKSGSGGVTVAEATGHVVVDSGSGAVACSAAGGDVRIRTGSGTVELGTVGGTCAISTGSGTVRLGRTEQVAVVKTGSGSTEVDHCAGELTCKSGSGAVRVRTGGRGAVRAKTASGTIRVAVPPGTPVWTEISSATGRIRSGLAPVGEPAEGQDHVALRLTTASGDIVLDQA